MPSSTAQTSAPSCVSTATCGPGFSCSNPITCPFDTDTDSDPDPELASPLNFSTVRAGEGVGCKKSIFSTTDSHRYFF
ncbi:MAG: hypothetical protein ACOX52_18315 [Verrucomicrobiota bacterium]